MYGPRGEVVGDEGRVSDRVDAVLFGPAHGDSDQAVPVKQQGPRKCVQLEEGSGFADPLSDENVKAWGLAADYQGL